MAERARRAWVTRPRPRDLPEFLLLALAVWVLRALAFALRLSIGVADVRRRRAEARREAAIRDSIHVKMGGQSDLRVPPEPGPAKAKPDPSAPRRYAAGGMVPPDAGDHVAALLSPGVGLMVPAGTRPSTADRACRAAERVLMDEGVEVTLDARPMPPGAFAARAHFGGDDVARRRERQ